MASSKWRSLRTILRRRRRLVIIAAITFLCVFFLGDSKNPTHRWSRHVVIEYEQDPTGSSHRNAVKRDLFLWLRAAPGLPLGMNATIYLEYLELLKVLSEVLTRHNVTFAMCDGTLLGSYVMHDILMWDDDIDIIVKYGDRDKLAEAFSTSGLPEQYDVGRYGPPEFDKFKFYKQRSPNAGYYPWRWPFIDIKFYKENKTHIWNFDVDEQQEYWDPRLFYPLHLRPLANLWLPAPYDTLAYLKLKYKTFNCKTADWDHETERGKWVKSVWCGYLKDFYPFVKREKSESGVLESLILAGEKLYSLTVQEVFHDSEEDIVV